MNRTRLALIGTLADLHNQPIRYDLAELVRIVAGLQPDLLGVEADRVDFERDDLSRAPIEVRNALLPLSRASDMVIVPIGSASRDELRAAGAGVRAALVCALDALLGGIQTIANDARRINSALVSHTCGLICHLEAQVSGERGRRAWRETNARMFANIVDMVSRDPTARILVATQCRRKHWLESQLRRMPDIELVDYWEL